MTTYENRRGRMVLQLCDASGAPLRGAAVNYIQQTHEFLFGCGAFDTLPATAPSEGATVDPDQPFYRDRVNKWLQLFNYGTLPFYWGKFEPVEGFPQTESRMRAAQFLQSRGVRVKGHPLCWHTACADWLMEYDNKTILRKQLDRIQREVSGFRGVVDI